MPVPQETTALLQTSSLSKGYLGFGENTVRMLPNRFMDHCRIRFKLRKVNVSHAWVWKLKSFTVFLTLGDKGRTKTA